MGNDISDEGRCNLRSSPPATILLSRASGLLENEAGRLGIGIGDVNALISLSRSLVFCFDRPDFDRKTSLVAEPRLDRKAGISYDG